MITVKCYGALKDALPRGHKGGIKIHATTMAEVRAALEQYLPFRQLLDQHPSEIRFGKTLKTSKTIPGIFAAEVMAKGEVDGEFTLHIVPGTGSGDEITTAMIVTALVSAAISVGVTLLMSLLFPPPETGNDGRKSALYQNGLTTQKEGVPLSYIAGEEVLCGINIIEADVDVVQSGGLATRIQYGPNGGGGGTANISPGYNKILNWLGGDKSGGGKQIANNSFSEATISILGALGAGEIGGILGVGSLEKGKNIYLNEVPLVGAGGGYNYQGVVWEERPGVAGQSIVGLTKGIGSNYDANVEIKYKNASGTRQEYPFVVTGAGIDFVKLRFDLVLVKQDKKGNQSNTSVAISVDTRRVGEGTWVNNQVATFTGKSSEPFQRQLMVVAPPVGADPDARWEFRITRVTDDSNDDKLNNQTKFNGWVEIETTDMPYDGSDGGEATALIGLQIDLAQFDQNNKPEVAVVCAGTKVRVPSNYVNGHYPNNGSIWDGSWAYQVTSNPVWHWFELATRVGVGVGVPETYFNKFSVDAAARYCDQMVNYTIQGVQYSRRRHTLNKQFTDSGKGWEKLRELAQSFRAVPYWDGSAVILVQDRPTAQNEEDAITLRINNSQVVDGQFVYSPTAAENRINRVEVEWDNPKDFWRVAIAEYQDDADIEVNKNQTYSDGGVLVQRVSKVGCTNEAEAYMFGRELVINSLYEDETVNWTMPITGVSVMPGDIVAIDDWNITGRKPVGRITSYTGGRNYFDGEGLDVKGGTRYVVHFTRADGTPGRVNYTPPADGKMTYFPSTAAMIDTPVSIFQETGGIRPTLWKVLSIQEKGPGEFEIQAQKFVFSKYALLDQNIPIPVTEWTDKNKNVPAPTNFKGKSISYQDDLRGTHHDIELSWSAVNDAALLQGYLLEVLAPGESVWRELYRGGNTVFTMRDVSEGVYLFTLKSVNTLGKTSEPVPLQFQFGQDSTVDGLFPPVFVGVNNS